MSSYGDFYFSFENGKLPLVDSKLFVDPEPETFTFTKNGLTLKAASRSALLRFANRVRDAGAGTPLSALLPAKPGILALTNS